MKNYKIIIVVVFLIGVLTLSTFLCACNKDNQPSGDNGQQSGNIDNNEQPSGDLNKTEQPSGNIQELPSGEKPANRTPDWVKIYSKRTCLSLQSDKCSAIIKSKEEFDAFCDPDTSSCLKKINTIYDIFPDISEEDIAENEYFNNSLIDAYNSANEEVIELFKDYDEKFFQEKSLVVLFRVRGTVGHYYDYKSHQVVGNTLNITLLWTIPDESVRYPAISGTYIYILEFDKEVVADVTQINVEDIQEHEK